MFYTNKRILFFKCGNFLSGEDYKQQVLDFIRKEQKLSNIMTKAKFQPFCRANSINLGYSEEIRVFPRTVIEGSKASFLHNNHFCLFWKSEDVSFGQAIEE